MEGREGKSSDYEVVGAREGKSIEKDNEILETTREARKEGVQIDEDEVTEAREGKSLEEDNEVVEASREESKEEDAVKVENVEAREGKSIVDEDNMLIRTKQARKGPLDSPMDGIFTLTTQNA